MKIEQPYKNFNDVQRLATKLKMYNEFHNFMARHCQTSIKDLDFLCYRFLFAAKSYFLLNGKVIGKISVVKKATKRFLTEF
jgi:hypothetical protein